MFRWFDEYYKHFALNLGQALQGVRYFYSHPDIDSSAPRGSLKHFAHSLYVRSRRVANDLFFAVIPPHWHHTPQQLAAMRNVPAARWFQYGYCAWRFTDSGEIKADLSTVDRRWDPR
ncbi:MAG: hypothetical protein AB7U20_07335, partial [Planctomycetaceae bacterium]